jgi:hypothetical protein
VNRLEPQRLTPVLAVAIICGIKMASRPARTSKPRAASSDMLARSKIPAWIVKALLSSGIKRVSKLSSMTDDELLALPGIGKRAIELVRSSQRACESGGSQAPNSSDISGSSMK